MRIAFSAASRNGLDSAISPHFGRCPCFVLVDIDGQRVAEVREVDNPYHANHQPGEVPAFIHDLEAEVMVAGGMGGRAMMLFQQYGIQGVTGAQGTVAQSLEDYLAGRLSGGEPCREGHHH